MELQTDQQKKDYYFGYVTRLADDLGVYDEVYKWACKYHSLSDWQKKVNELLQKRINQTNETPICNSCGAEDSRVCNGDNEVCTECGTPDDFSWEDNR